MTRSGTSLPVLQSDTHGEDAPGEHEEQQKIAAGHEGEGELVQDDIAGGILCIRDLNVNVVDQIASADGPAEHEYIEDHVADSPEGQHQPRVAYPGGDQGGLSLHNILASEEDDLDDAAKASDDEENWHKRLQWAVCHVDSA